jgi:hypothetical protein
MILFAQGFPELFKNSGLEILPLVYKFYVPLGVTLKQVEHVPEVVMSIAGYTCFS